MTPGCFRRSSSMPQKQPPARTIFRVILFSGDKSHGKRIHAVSGIFFGEMFPDKDMSQVSSAVGTGDLRAPPVGIQTLLHRTGNLFIKTRPTAIGTKFSF